MSWLVIIAVLLLLSVALTVLFGPPYLPTLNQQAEAALDMLDLKPGQTLLDLGSGDGRVLRAAAKRGLTVVGIELSPLLVIVSYITTWRYRKSVTIIMGNYFRVKWPKADGIFTFMIQRQMGKLDKQIKQWGKPVRLASVAFTISGKDAADERAGVFLYKYE
jgi:SAM-dependent methyltransferase